MLQGRDGGQDGDQVGVTLVGQLLLPLLDGGGGQGVVVAEDAGAEGGLGRLVHSRGAGRDVPGVVEVGCDGGRLRRGGGSGCGRRGGAQFVDGRQVVDEVGDGLAELVLDFLVFGHRGIAPSGGVGGLGGMGTAVF